MEITKEIMLRVIMIQFHLRRQAKVKVVLIWVKCTKLILRCKQLLLQSHLSTACILCWKQLKTHSKLCQGFRSLLLISYSKDMFSRDRRRIADSLDKFRWWAGRQSMLFTWAIKINAILFLPTLRRQRDSPFNRGWSLSQSLTKKSFGSQSKLKQMHPNQSHELLAWRWEKPFQKLTEERPKSSLWKW